MGTLQIHRAQRKHLLPAHLFVDRIHSHPAVTEHVSRPLAGLCTETTSLSRTVVVRGRRHLSPGATDVFMGSHELTTGGHIESYFKD